MSKLEVLLHKRGSPDLKMKIPSAADEQIAEVSTAILSKIRSSTEKSSISFLSNPKESSTISQEEQLENTRMKMGELREENERLKLFLAQIIKDYRFLQKKYFDFVHHDQSKNTSDPESTTDASNNDIVEEEPDQLVSLTLGTNSSGTVRKVQVEEIKEGEANLSLGLDCKLFEGPCRKGSDQNHEIESNNNNNNNTQSPEKSSTEEAKELDEPWLPSKALKNDRSSNGGDDEVLQQPLAKKARVSVRVRCDTPTMSDGCQWRKYGQKIAKGNPCPRAYYRCTVAPGCPVRKQVQRSAEDTSILITTYEGTHNHPLSVAAAAMASTTAAAVSMLTSTSSASPQGIPQGVGLFYSSSTATTPSLGGLNVGLFDTSSRPITPQSYLTIPSLSSTLSYPTISIDLTSPLPPWTPHLNHFNRLIPSPYSSTNFNFSSSLSTMSPPSWSSEFLSSGSHAYTSSLSLIERQARGSSHYQSVLHKTTGSASSDSNQNSPLITDSIAKAITSNPSFQSAIAAAITSYVRSHGAAQNGEGASGASYRLKLGEQSAQLNVNGCGSS